MKPFYSNKIVQEGGIKMGSYLNPGATSFRNSLRSEIYIDKSGLIEETNKRINTEQRYICVSRPRRFGKSMAANMLAAYVALVANAPDERIKKKISGIC